MRSNHKGFIFLSIAVSLAVLCGVLWFLHVKEEARIQRMLEQAQEADAAAPSAALREAANARTPPGGVLDPAGTASERKTDQPSPVLVTALAFTGFAALGFAGYSYRLASEGRRVRYERDRLALALDTMRGDDVPGGDIGRGELPAGRTVETRILETLRADPSPSAVFDQDARVLAVSPVFTDITGYTAKEIPDAKSWFTTLLRTPPDQVASSLHAFSNRTRGDIETRTVWTHGAEARTWLCMPLEAWPLGAKRALLVARAVDITEEKRAVSAAREDAEHLRAALEEANASAQKGTVAAPPAPSPEAGLADELATRRAECERMTARVRAIEAEIAAQRAHVLALERSAAERGDKLAVREAECERVTARVRALEAELAAQHSQVSMLQTEASTLRAKLTARDLECERATARIAAVEADLGAQTSQASALHSAASRHARLADAAQTRVKELEAGIAGVEQQLASVQQFAEQFDASLWLADPRIPRLIYATPQTEKLRGRAVTQMMEDFSLWTAPVHDEDRERVRQALANAAVLGTYDIEYRVVRDDGSVAWLHDHAIAVRDAGDRLRHLAGMTTDITVRRNAEDMMRSTLVAMKAIVEQAPAVIWMKNAQGRYLYVNREYERLTDFGAEQLRGKTDFDLYPRSVAERMHEHDVRTLAANSALQFEESVQHGDGTRRYVVCKFPVHGAESLAGALCGISFDITARCESEDALRREADRYRAMAASLPQGLVAVRDGRVMYANAAAAQLAGAASAQALIGAALPAFAAGDDGQWAESAKALALQASGPRRFAARMKNAEGREIDVDVGAAAVETPTERLVEYVIRDVSEPNARLRAAEQAQAFYRELCDQSAAALRVIDAESRCTFASPRWAELGGTGAGEDPWQRVHADDRARVREAFRAPSGEVQVRGLEYRLGDASGAERWIVEQLVPRHDAGGRWKGYVAAAIDISERKRIEDAVLGERNDLAALLEQCPAPVWVIDVSAGAGYANAACLEWLGASADDKERVDLRHYLHAEEIEPWTELRARMAQDRSRYEAEYRVRRHDGAYRSVHIAAVPVPSGEGANRFLVILTDVTEQRATARALAVAQTRCEQVVNLVAQRSDPLAQVRQSAEVMRVLFPGDARLQQVSARVLSEAQQLDSLLAEMLAMLPAQAARQA